MKKTTKGKATKKAAPKKAAGKSQAAKSKAPAKKSQRASAQENEQDIIQLILADHKPLKKLIKIMKDSDNDLSERQEAFEEFAPLLVTHAKPEEQTMYVFMKDEEELREEGFEGDVEHTLADQLVEEIKRTDDEDLWGARVKVLAEMVEHHIEEEEEELLPDFKKNSDPEQRMELGSEYLRLKAELEEMGGKDAPSEKATDLEDEEEDTHANH